MEAEIAKRAEFEKRQTRVCCAICLGIIQRLKDVFSKKKTHNRVGSISVKPSNKITILSPQKGNQPKEEGKP